MTLIPNSEFLAMTQEERNRIMAEQYANFVAKKATESAPLVGGGRKKPQAATATVQLVRGSDVVPEPIQWLWPGFLAQGKLHVLAGAPGTGKTTLALRLAAIVSSGGQWPSGGYCPVANVVLWSGEDDIKDTLVPRLIAAGADMGHVHFVDGVSDADGLRSFDPAKDVNAGEILQRLAGGKVQQVLKQ